VIPLFFALLLAQEPQAAKWTVKGSVINALTGEPLRKVTVTLKGAAHYSAITDAEGEFSIEGERPDEFEIHAYRQGFMEFVDSRKFKIPGSGKKDLAIKLTPQCVLAGKVVDEDGDPMENAEVFIARRIAGRETFSQSSNADDEGHFTITGLNAGTYILSASDPRAGNAQAWSPHARVDYVRTYYPASLTAAGAVPLVLAAGAQNRNLEIRLRKERVFHVRGRITNLPKLYGFVVLAATDEARREEKASSQIREGKFECTGILPGDYVVRMSFWSFNRETKQVADSTMFGSIPLTVGDHDVDDLILDLAPGATINGSIKMEGSAKPPSTWPLLYMAGESDVRTMSIKEDGAFTWSDVPPDVFKIRLAPAEGVYLKSIRFNGQPVSTTAWDLTSGAGGTLEITLSPNAAEISGVVRDNGGASAGDRVVTVWASGEAPRSAPSNADGTFRFGSLAPGEYHVLAWEEIEHDWATTPEFLGRFKSIDVKLQEGSKENLDLKMVPKKAIQEETARLQ
jgi:hypothetical protein